MEDVKEGMLFNVLPIHREKKKKRNNVVQKDETSRIDNTVAN